MRENKMKSKRILFYISLLLLLIILSMGLFSFSNSEIDILLMILPITYLVIYMGVIRIPRYLNNPGIFTLNAVSVIRYVILPIMIIISKDYERNYLYAFEGTILMIYELTCTSILLLVVTRKYYKTSSGNILKASQDDNILLKLVVIISIILVIMDPNILSQFTFVFSSASEVNLIKSSEVVSGLPSLIVNWGKMLLPVMLCIYFVNKYKRRKKSIDLITVFLIMLIFNVLFFSGTSRSSVVMPAIGSLFFLIKVFKEKSKQIFLVMSLLIVIVTLQLTVLKTTYIGNTIQTDLNSMIDYLEIYFAGPNNLGTSIETKKVFSDVFSLSTLKNDVIGNFPGLSNFTNAEDRTATYFNLVYYSGGPSRDMIVPSIGQGLFYLGFIFSYLPQALIIFGMALWDSKYKLAENTINVYIAATFAVRFGFTYVQSVSSILGYVYSVILPIVVLLSMNKYINKTFSVRKD